MVSLFRAQLPQLRRLRPGRLGSKQRLGRPKASCAFMEHSEEGHLFFWSVAHFPNKTGFISWHNHQKVVYKSGSPSKRPLGVSIYSRNHVKALHAPQKTLVLHSDVSASIASFSAVPTPKGSNPTYTKVSATGSVEAKVPSMSMIPLQVRPASANVWHEAPPRQGSVHLQGTGREESTVAEKRGRRMDVVLSSEKGKKPAVSLYVCIVADSSQRFHNSFSRP